MLVSPMVGRVGPWVAGGSEEPGAVDLLVGREGVCPSPASCLAWGIPGLVLARSEAWAQEGGFQNVSCQHQHPWDRWAPKMTAASVCVPRGSPTCLSLRKALQGQQVSWPRLLSNSRFFPGSQRVRFCVCPLRVEFVSHSLLISWK